MYFKLVEEKHFASGIQDFRSALTRCMNLEPHG